jgi:hypothetical protein
MCKGYDAKAKEKAARKRARATLRLRMYLEKWAKEEAAANDS